MAVGITTLLSAWLGLGCLYGVCRKFSPPRDAAFSAAAMFLGTTVLYYSAIEVGMAHGMATAAVAGYLCFWVKTYGSWRTARWFIVGTLLGFCVLMRWQLATLAVLPIGELIFLASGRREPSAPGQHGEWIVRAPLSLSSQGLVSFTTNVAVFAVGALLAFLPQMIAWRVVYGGWLADPIPVSRNWFQPALSEVLLSQNRGLFYWTPLALVALLGFASVFGWEASRRLLHRERQREQQIVLLVAAFALQVYALASLWGTGVYLGVAYGFRHLTESTVLLAPGLALLLSRLSGPARLTLRVL